MYIGTFTFTPTCKPHSFWPFLQRPFQSSTTQRRSRLHHGYCIGVSRRSEEATVGKGLAQGPYMAARAGIEPTTLRLKGIVSTKAPPRPTTCLQVPALLSATFKGLDRGAKFFWRNRNNRRD